MERTLIVGLGNPGPQYVNTRHNIGFMVVDELASRLRVNLSQQKFNGICGQGRLPSGEPVTLLKPQTFMNASGRSLSTVLRYHKLPAESMLVIYDDLTLNLGRIKLSVNGSAGGHNGIADILTQVGIGFARFRVGIGAKTHREMDLADYVLSKFSKDELSILADRSPIFLDHIHLILNQGIESSMKTINQRIATSYERND